MATVEIEVKKLREYLEQRIPEAKAAKKAYHVANIKAAISRRRSVGFKFLTLRKSEEDIRADATRAGEIRYDYPLDRAIYAAERFLAACSISSVGYITASDEDCVLLHRIGYMNPKAELPTYESFGRSSGEGV